MNEIMDLIQGEVGLPPSIQIQILKTMFIIVILVITHRVIKNILYRMIEDSTTYYRTKKSVVYVFIAIGVMIVGRVWFKGIQSLTTFLGLFSAGLAIAMKDLVMNVAGWAYILSKRLFRVGDRIEVGDVSGDVIDIQLFQFTLMENRNWVSADQSTGRIVHISNSVIFSKAVFNYNRGLPYIWDEIPINVTLESDWKKAKQILQEIADEYGEATRKEANISLEEASKEFLIYNKNPDPTVYTSLSNEYSITLTIRYMCDYRSRRTILEQMYESVIERFDEHPDIEFAYPTQRIYQK